MAEGFEEVLKSIKTLSLETKVDQLFGIMGVLIGFLVKTIDVVDCSTESVNSRLNKLESQCEVVISVPEPIKIEQLKEPKQSKKEGVHNTPQIRGAIINELKNLFKKNKGSE